MNKNEKRYFWECKSSDGAYEYSSLVEDNRTFATKKECYEDMRNSALEKMKWNTEYNEDFTDVGEGDDEYIGYNVKFKQNQIIHESYSGIYVYTIHEVGIEVNIKITLNCKNFHDAYMFINQRLFGGLSQEECDKMVQAFDVTPTAN